ncbi:HLH-domain-containing protein [Backusella circina FSU 941]|nr:HLH-domain-containing protein [Backusella circina FSU 941]
MIWHMHDNEHNGGLVLLKEMNNTTQYRFSKSSLSMDVNNTPSTNAETDDDENESSEDSMSESGSSKQPGCSLFLNFSSDLTLQQPTKKKGKGQASYKVNGVNILNRKNLDSKTVIERIQKRRENHNHVERRRRDCINNTILDISKVIPNACLPGQKPNKGAILKLALDHILYLQAENNAIKRQLFDSQASTSSNLQTAPSYTCPSNNDQHYHQQRDQSNWPVYKSPTIIQPVTPSSFSAPQGNISASVPYTTDSASAPIAQTTNLRPLLPQTQPQQNNVFISYYDRPQKNTCRYL